MARYKVILAYDGTSFSGSQRQANARTVQGVFERALRKLDWGDQSVILAGRTDTGVHASGQVVAFDLNWNHPADVLLRALNSLLPEDVAVRSVEICADDFHPRLDALQRSYHYSIFCDPVRDPLRERYAWRVWPAPDFNLLQHAASEVVGAHDFAPFGRPTRPDGSTIREVSQASWEQHAERLTFKVTANAYLYHMVRRMVFVQVSIGWGRLDAGIITRVFTEPDPQTAQNQSVFQGLAPPNGLSLVDITYPNKL